MNYIQKGIDEGATLLSGGVGTPDKITKGFFVKPHLVIQEHCGYGLESILHWLY